jgi:hypothetical protein
MEGWGFDEGGDSLEAWAAMFRGVCRTKTQIADKEWWDDFVEWTVERTSLKQEVINVYAGQSSTKFQPEAQAETAGYYRRTPVDRWFTGFVSLHGA